MNKRFFKNALVVTRFSNMVKRFLVTNKNNMNNLISNQKLPVFLITGRIWSSSISSFVLRHEFVYTMPHFLEENHIWYCNLQVEREKLVFVLGTKMFNSSLINCTGCGDWSIILHLNWWNHTVTLLLIILLSLVFVPTAKRSNSNLEATKKL